MALIAGGLCNFLVYRRSHRGLIGGSWEERSVRGLSLALFLDPEAVAEPEGSSVESGSMWAAVDGRLFALVPRRDGLYDAYRRPEWVEAMPASFKARLDPDGKVWVSPRRSEVWVRVRRDGRSAHDAWSEWYRRRRCGERVSRFVERMRAKYAPRAAVRGTNASAPERRGCRGKVWKYVKQEERDAVGSHIVAVDGPGRVQ